MSRRNKALEDAIASEQAIADEAAEIRGDAVELDRALFLKLRPLLRQPIPEGFIQRVGVVKGKPYDSAGIKSVQVQMDRMDAVLTPMWWTLDDEYEQDGAVCEVTVAVTGQDFAVVRSSRGGVDRASTKGNLYKGSFTNAAKPAIARIGPGWEVYVGATDLDPDVHKQTAEQQAKGEAPAPDRKLPAEKVEPLERAIKAAGLEAHLPAKLTSFGVKSIPDLTVEQAVPLYEWCKGTVRDGS